MLQRIQTVYLLIFIVCSIALLFVPLYELTIKDGYYSFSIIKTSFIGPAGTAILGYNFPLIIVIVLMVILLIITIFRYDSRRFQLKLINANIVLLLLFAAVIGYNYIQLAGLSGSESVIKISWSLAVIPFQMILLLIAGNAIRKDEALVRSADRLR